MTPKNGGRQSQAAAAGTQGLISDMRMLVHATEKAPRLEEALSDERVVSYKVATALMVLLVGLILATSALPDLIPRLARLIPGHL
jgi:hypothetical protein